MYFRHFHPAILLLYFSSVLFCTLFFNHPILLVLSCLCAVGSTLSLGKKQTPLFVLTLFIVGALLTLFYASYQHFGLTKLKENFIGNNITLEALVYGGTLSFRFIACIMWLYCATQLCSSDNVIYLVGRLCPTLSLYLSILFHMTVVIGKKAGVIYISRKAIGKGLHIRRPFYSVKNAFSMLSMLITFTLERFIQKEDTMKSRGYGQRKRTAFSIYRFDYRDRTLVLYMFFLLSLLLAATLFDQTRILYNPEIILNKITPLSFVFYLAYAALCMLPLSLNGLYTLRLKRNLQKA